LEKAIEEKVIELMEEGREWEDLAPILLGEVKGAEGASATRRQQRDT